MVIAPVIDAQNKVLVFLDALKIDSTNCASALNVYAKIKKGVIFHASKKCFENKIDANNLALNHQLLIIHYKIGMFYYKI